MSLHQDTSCVVIAVSFFCDGAVYTRPCWDIPLLYWTLHIQARASSYTIKVMSFKVGIFPSRTGALVNNSLLITRPPTHTRPRGNYPAYPPVSTLTRTGKLYEILRTYIQLKNIPSYSNKSASQPQLTLLRQKKLTVTIVWATIGLERGYMHLHPLSVKCCIPKRRRWRCRLRIVRFLKSVPRYLTLDDIRYIHTYVTSFCHRTLNPWAQ